MVDGYDTVTGAEGDVANSFEFMFDINIGTEESPNWVNVPELTALNPQHTPKNRDVTTYKDRGSTNNKKVGADFTLDFNILKIRDNLGEFQSYWLFLKEAADADGEANNVDVRYYDSRGASDAYRGKVSVSRGARPSTGNDDPGWDNFTFASVGRMAPIPNPLGVAIIPLISTATPSGEGVDEQVLLKGSRFTGVTTITIGGTAVKDFTIVDDTTAVITLPAGAAGSSPIIATSPAGPSVAKAYTRAV